MRPLRTSATGCLEFNGVRSARSCHCYAFLFGRACDDGKRFNVGVVVAWLIINVKAVGNRNIIDGGVRAIAYVWKNARGVGLGLSVATAGMSEVSTLCSAFSGDAVVLPADAAC